MLAKYITFTLNVSARHTFVQIGEGIHHYSVFFFFFWWQQTHFSKVAGQDSKYLRRHCP